MKGTDGHSQNNKAAFAAAMQALDGYKECCQHPINTFLPMLHPGVYLRYNTKAPKLTTTHLHEQYERTAPQ